METRPSAGQAASQTPEVPVAKGATFAFAQKHWLYVAASACGAAGGTQAPFASWRGPQFIAQAGSWAVF